jgi:hypothetical protein
MYRATTLIAAARARAAVENRNSGTKKYAGAGAAMGQRADECYNHKFS